MNGKTFWFAKSLRNTNEGLKNYWVCSACSGKTCATLLPLDKEPRGCKEVRQ